LVVILNINNKKINHKDTKETQNFFKVLRG
jgi:hypothetical protein